jgi:hypothetical protein
MVALITLSTPSQQIMSQIVRGTRATVRHGHKAELVYVHFASICDLMKAPSTILSLSLSKYTRDFAGEVSI